jgi:aspartyl-tRNA(Asn)/glutamyl-tRNA(Gln) amidotransferase subunit C
MSISRREVEHVAGLCRLSFGQEEVERLREELGRILGYVEKLKELDVTNVEATLRGLDGTAALREDVPDGSGLSREEALGQAPDEENGHFKVPGVF